MIILFGGEKGGTGKTSLAVNLAAMRARAGYDVLLVDADRQESAAAWSAVRDQAGVEPRVPVVQKFGSSLAQEVKGLAEKYQDVIIDTGGRDSTELRAALVVADRFFVPIRPSQFDLWALEKVTGLVEECRPINPNLEAIVLVNLASTHPRVEESAETREYLDELDGVSLARTVLRERIAFRKAAREGLAVVELRPADPKAAAELESLYAEVFNG